MHRTGPHHTPPARRWVSNSLSLYLCRARHGRLESKLDLLIFAKHSLIIAGKCYYYFITELTSFAAETYLSPPQLSVCEITSWPKNLINLLRDLLQHREGTVGQKSHSILLNRLSYRKLTNCQRTVQTSVSTVAVHDCNRARRLWAMWNTGEIMKQKNKLRTSKLRRACVGKSASFPPVFVVGKVPLWSGWSELNTFQVCSNN